MEGTAVCRDEQSIFRYGSFFYGMQMHIEGFGAAYTLQKLQNGEWSNLPYAIENGAFTMEAYNLPKGEPQTLTVSWGWLYGLFRVLPQEIGPYRACSNHPFNGWF